MNFLPLASRADWDSVLEFRYNPKVTSPTTHMHTVHTWVNAIPMWCSCGKYSRDNKRLRQLTRAELPTFFGVLCKRCTWSDPGLAKRLQEKP